MVMRGAGLLPAPRKPGSTSSTLAPRAVAAYLLPLALLLTLSSSPVRAHDASAWGGLFRSRDYGATWFPANPGHFVGGAIALAISPTDVNHLLLASDSGLLRSRNGGRDWDLEAPSVLVGAVFAAVFDADGQRALVSTGSGIFRADGENRWRKTPAPTEAAPARAIVRGSGAGRAYLAGWKGLFRSDDWGASWSNAAEGLPDGPATALVVTPGSPETVYVILDGRVWASTDGTRTWRNRAAGMPAVNVDALGLDPSDPTRVLAAGADQLFRSNDQGARWEPVGRALPQPNTAVRGIAVSGTAMVLSTDRGLYRSADGGQQWVLLIENLPAHLEAGPLVCDPINPATGYAGFALMPYPELWRRAAEGRGSLAQLDLTSLVGGAAFLIIMALSAVVSLRWLVRYYRTPAGSVSTPRERRHRRIEEGRR
jgi:photosystem II stability/assembly factor-like uncharacterized protein